MANASTQAHIPNRPLLRNSRVLPICGSSDWHKSIDGLCAVIMNQFELNPKEEVIFAFCNRTRNRIKLLVWDDNGFKLHLKRIEKVLYHGPISMRLKSLRKISVRSLRNLVVKSVETLRDEIFETEPF